MIQITIVSLVFLVIIINSVNSSSSSSSSSSSDHQHVYTDSFPTNDEYDIMALDPSTAYGTPYGGFSRATASRLASLPLTLPYVSIENENDDVAESATMYTTVRDNFGRPFVCKTYHEDELETDSLGDSMFDTPRLKQTNKSSSSSSSSSSSNDIITNSDEENNIEDDYYYYYTSSASTVTTNTFDIKGDDLATADAASITTEKTTPATSTTEKVAAAMNKHDGDKVDGDTGNGSSNSNSNKRTPASKLNPIMLGHEIHQRLSKLVGLCAQLHPGWWSYEYCYQEKVTQFHVSISTKKKTDGSGDTVQDFKLEDVTNLGSFSGRSIKLATDEDTSTAQQQEQEQQQPIDLAQNRKELGRVIENFIGGDSCPDTGKPRVTQATFRCCSQAYLSKSKGGILKNGKPFETDLVTIFAAADSKEDICHYNITLCTPLLCDDYINDSNEEDGSYFSSTTSASKSETTAEKSNKVDQQKKHRINLNLDPVEAESMSVIEILQNTFGTDGDFCIRTATGEWWQVSFLVYRPASIFGFKESIL